MQLIDTHNHLCAPDFDSDAETIAHEAAQSGVRAMLICAGTGKDFPRTRELAHKLNTGYALGFHPLYLPQSIDDALGMLHEWLETNRDDPHLAAVGEIGIDGYNKELDPELQRRYLAGQLRLARMYDLPVSVHARHAVDATTSLLRRQGSRGIVHAFNGSEQQASMLIKSGMKLGFGGAMLFSGSKRIRRLFSAIPETAFVLETDAPDMPSPNRIQSPDCRTHVADIVSYVREAALLRGISEEEICRISTQNALCALPRLAAFL